MNPAAAPPDIRAVLRNGPFARYMSGELISMLGTWMQSMALGWVLTDITDSAFTLALVNLATGLPMLALTMWGGVVADRFDKRRILFASQVVQALIAAAIGWLVATHHITVAHVIIAGFFLGVSTAFEMPAASALVPELVPRDQLASALAIDRSLFHATRLAGPAIGGWLIGWLGTASAFYANAISFGALMIALLTIHPRPRGTAEEEEMRQTGMKEGLRFVRGDRPTRSMMLLLACGTTFISPFFMIMMPLYSRHILHIGADKHGILMGSSGLGAFAGSLWLLAIPAHRRAAYLRCAVAVIFVCLGGLALAGNLAVAVVSMICLTVGTATMFGLANTIVQERAPDALRGRVSALLGLCFFGVLPFSGLVMSKYADLVGLRIAMGSGALCFGLAAAASLHSSRGRSGK